MIQLIREWWYLFILAAIVLVTLMVLAVRELNRRKQEREAYQKQLQDQVLNQALRNSLAKRNLFKEQDPASPVEAAPERKLPEAEERKIVVSLTVWGDDVQEYVVNPSAHVLIGSQAGRNEVVLQSGNIAQQHCDIFTYKNHVYVRNMNASYETILRRKKSSVRLGHKGVQLCSGDQLLIGPYEIQVNVLDYMGNVIPG